MSGVVVIVLGVKPVVSQPRERALHDPAFGQYLEPLAAVEAFDDFQCPAEHRPRPVDTSFLVSTIDEDFHEPGDLAMQAQQEQMDTTAVGSAGGMDHDAEQ